MVFSNAFGPGALSRRAALCGLTTIGAAPATVLAQPAAPPTPGPAPLNPDDLLPSEKDWTSRLTTPVTINGSGPFRFIIDTGANRSVISSQVAASLSLPSGKPTLVHDIVGARPAPTVDVKTFSAGGIPIPIHDIPVLEAEGLGAQGILGIDAFHNRQVTFDFVRELVRISRPSVPYYGSPVPSLSIISETTIRAEQRSGQLTIVDAQAVDRRITCFLDSGAQASVGNLAMRRLIRARTGGSGLDIPVVLHGATGHDAPGEIAMVPTMRLGHLHFTSFAMAFADLHTFSLWRLNDRPAMMVGMDLLSRFAMVTLDFGEKAVTFKMAASLGRQLA